MICQYLFWLFSSRDTLFRWLHKAYAVTSSRIIHFHPRCKLALAEDLILEFLTQIIVFMGAHDYVFRRRLITKRIGLINHRIIKMYCIYFRIVLHIDIILYDFFLNSLDKVKLHLMQILVYFVTCLHWASRYRFAFFCVSNIWLSFIKSYFKWCCRNHWSLDF